MSDQDDLDLATLNDEDLVAQMHDDLYDGLADEILEGTTICSTAAGVPTGCSTTRWSKACASSASTSVTGSCSSPRCCWPPTR